MALSASKVATIPTQGKEGSSIGTCVPEFFRENFVLLQGLGVICIIAIGSNFLESKAIAAPPIDAGFSAINGTAELLSQPNSEILRPSNDNKPSPDQAIEGSAPPSNDKIVFVNNGEGFTPKEIQIIAQGINRSRDFWHARGLKGAQLNNTEVWVYNYSNNESSFVSGNWVIRLGSHDESTAGHEATHAFLGLRVEGLPGFFEGPAVMSQMLLFGGSTDSRLPAKITNFNPSGKHFINYGNQVAMVENYNKAGTAAIEIDKTFPGFWAEMGNRYYDWIMSQPHHPFGRAVSQPEFRQWVEDFQPGLWQQLQKYPILFLQP